MAGTANRLLNLLCRKSLQGFPQALAGAETIGNPVRRDIAALYAERKTYEPESTLHLLVLGGSLGAKAINEVLPVMIKQLPPQYSLQIWHQTGPGTHEATLNLYQQQGVVIDGQRLRVSAYIEDMAAAYRWADVMLCRAGAMTLAEITCAGLPAVLVPLPNAIDDHQNKNAAYLAEKGAAIVIPQHTLSADHLLSTLTEMMMRREKLVAMSKASQEIAPIRATHDVANVCLQLAGISSVATGMKHG